MRKAKMQKRIRTNTISNKNKNKETTQHTINATTNNKQAKENAS